MSKFQAISKKIGKNHTGYVFTLPIYMMPAIPDKRSTSDLAGLTVTA